MELVVIAARDARRGASRSRGAAVRDALAIEPAHGAGLARVNDLPSIRRPRGRRFDTARERDLNDACGRARWRLARGFERTFELRRHTIRARGTILDRFREACAEERSHPLRRLDRKQRVIRLAADDRGDEIRALRLIEWRTPGEEME